MIITYRISDSVSYYHLEDFIKNDIIESVETWPNIIAFGCVCPTIPICNQLARRIKKINNSVITAVGGAHINVALKKTMEKYPSFDRYSYGYDFEAVTRLINEDVKPLSIFPYVDYSILPYKLNEYDINLFSTLGCPFRCAYCQDGRMPYYEYLLDGGISLIRNQLSPNKLIHFFDSTLGYSEKRIFQICEALTNLNHNFILSCDIRAEFITEKTVVALENAGFREIRMGLETVDGKVLKKNNRSILPDIVMKKIELIRNYSNLYLTLYTVSGLSGYTQETYDNNRKLYRYLLENRMADEIKNAQFVPYPRDDYDYEKLGIVIKDENWENYDRQSYPVYETQDLKREQIWKGFLETAKTINSAWLKGWGLQSIEELSHIESYPEYIVNSYLERSNYEKN